jgi:hypothetical protein
MRFATANGGRLHGEKQADPQTNAKACSEASGPQAIEVGRTKQSDVLELTTDLRSGDQRIHRVVLLGTKAS